MTVRVLLDMSGDGQLDSHRRLIAAACRIAGDAPVEGLIATDGSAEAAAAIDAIARINGLARLRVIAFDAAGPITPGRWAAVLDVQMADCDSLVAADDGIGRHVVPLVAAALGTAPLTGISAITDDGLFERPLYASAIIERLRYEAPQRLITVRPQGFAPAGEQAPCPIDPTSPPTATGNVVFAAPDTSADAGRDDLASARIVVGGGRGLGSADGFRLLEELAERLQAAIGASRVAVDMGWLPHNRQIGQTGRRIAPTLYVAVGISGAPQHLSGVKDAGLILAIDKDPEAAIFGAADYGVVGDFSTIIPALIEALDRR